MITTTISLCAADAHNIATIITDLIRVNAPCWAAPFHPYIAVVNGAPPMAIRARRKRELEKPIGRVHVAHAEADVPGLAAAAQHVGRLDKCS